MQISILRRFESSLLCSFDLLFPFLHSLILLIESLSVGFKDSLGRATDIEVLYLSKRKSLFRSWRI
jgi:hypothetical protein